MSRDYERRKRTSEMMNGGLEKQNPYRGLFQLMDRVQVSSIEYITSVKEVAKIKPHPTPLWHYGKLKASAHF
ncbi:hypothetical protein EYF80_031892 [Liparis tanakae]|uniref:Uncharacterized protein n=1 Tax=Liparis tanakae TaxID=230148 RepID=A0A4Z2GYP1_9TELE|nr:hypothetical protein EYF80_031892 [Liparis tanakae]